MQKKIHLMELMGQPDASDGGPKLVFPKLSQDGDSIPRHLRNPHTAVFDVLSRLDTFVVSELGLRPLQIIQERFLPFWTFDACIDEPETEFMKAVESGGHPVLVASEITLGLCSKAIISFNEGKTTEAWSYAIDAESWLGNVFAGTKVLLAAGDAKSAMARKGADAIHTENRAMKSEVFAWLADNRSRFKSRAKAAAAVQKLQPITYRTAYGWIEQWEKLQAAGKT